MVSFGLANKDEFFVLAAFVYIEITNAGQDGYSTATATKKKVEACIKIASRDANQTKINKTLYKPG